MELHRGRLLRCYSERSGTVDAMFRQAVAAAGDAPALVDGAVRWSYDDLDARVDRLAAGFFRVGVRRGDRVAVVLANRLEAALTTLAVARLGAVLVPIGTRLRKPEIGYILENAGTACLVYEAGFEDEMPPGAPALRFCVGASALGTAPFGSLDDGGTLGSIAEPHEDDPFAIVYTSGTTGRPKGAVLTHLGAIHSTLHWQDVLRLGDRECTLLCIPWSHVAGLCGVVVPFLCSGHCIVLMREFKRREFLALAAAERITHALLVPAMYGLCLLEVDLESFDLSCWRLGLYGSAPMPEATIRRFSKSFPGLVMCNAYGASETASPATIMPPGEGIRHADSIGRVVPCGEIFVMDEEGREVGCGDDGEFWIGGPMVASGYWQDEEATRLGFVDGFWRSGDIGSIDAAGYVRIADRKKDMIIRGGFKIYPAEVENVLCELEGVIEAAVVGTSDDMLGEQVVAYLSVRSGGADVPLVDEERVRSFCKERMADYKVPWRVVVEFGPLPRNANGKIQKDQLRDRMKGAGFTRADEKKACAAASS